MKKIQFSSEILIKKSQNVSEHFQIILDFLEQSRKVLHECFLISMPDEK